MDISQERLNALIANPSESLNVELKRWISPTEPRGVSKIALAAIALRNRNGGYLVVGFDDNTLLPDSSNVPDDVRATFHVDVIQGIISKYASIPFEIQVGFGVRDGREYPIIAVPEGTTVPVAAKGDLLEPGNAKPLIRVDTVYFRTLASNGTPSTSAAKSSDWREIIEICFENREADIGRFLRRHLGGENLVRFITNAQAELAGLAPTPTAADRAQEVLVQGKNFRDEAIKGRTDLTARDREFLQLGTWSVALAVDPPLPATDSSHEFLNRIAGSNPQYTGWPIWLDSRNFSDERSRPYKMRKAWEALIVSTSADMFSNHVDFMRMDAKGEFYLWRVLQDDTSEKLKPKTRLDPALMVYRVTEAIVVGISFARALGCEESSTLGFCFEWDGIKGRSLQSWANPEIYISSYGKAQENTISTRVEVPLTTPITSVTPYVSQAVAELFSAFDGFVYPERGIEQRVEKLLNRQW